MLSSFSTWLLQFGSSSSTVVSRGGREDKPIGAHELAKAVEEPGGGEMLLNSIDCDVEKLPVSAWKMLWKMGKEDPRRVVHGLKVGAALTLVSFLYLLEPLFLGIGQNAMWAVMTVVVVLEPTTGATLGKGLNRGIGTVSAGSLAFFVEFVAEETGEIGRAIFVGSFVFLVGFMETYLRFIPYIKKSYDYGMVIFLLTFNLITVSSYRVFEVIEIAHMRIYMIGIGCAICLFLSLLILPNWSGENLHASSISKLHGLARSVEVGGNVQ